MVYEINNYDAFKLAIDEICAELALQGIPQEKIFDCKLASHELIGNVLQHSGGSAYLEVSLSEEYIQVSVRAERIFEPPTKGTCPSAEVERGRGLYLIDSVCVERLFTEEGVIVVRLAR